MYGQQQYFKKSGPREQLQQIMARPPSGHKHMPPHIYRQRKKIPVNLMRK